MSAFVCNDEHLKALAVYVSVRRPPYGRSLPSLDHCGHWLDDEQCAKINKHIKKATQSCNDDAMIAQCLFNVLLDENTRSVYERYRQYEPEQEPVYISIANRDIIRPDVIDPVAILKMCDCYEYQACECADWHKTAAHWVIGQVRKCAIGLLPGYEKAPWSYAKGAGLTLTG